MNYNVKTLRSAGLEAKWTKTRRGAPIMVARDPNSDQQHQRSRWWYVDRMMWELMQKLGVREGFDSATLLGDLFSI